MTSNPTRRSAMNYECLILRIEEGEGQEENKDGESPPP